MIWPILSAVLGILAFLPANFYFLGFVFLVPLFFFFAKEEKFWRLLAGAFIFRLIFGLGAAYFSLEPLTWAISILIFLGLPVSVFLFKKLLTLIATRWKTDARLKIYLTLAFLPFVWTFFDHLEARYSLLPTYIVTAGNIFGSSPFAGLAGIAGLLGLTFFAALINSLLVLPFLKTNETRSLSKSTAIFAVIATIILSGWQISKQQIQKNAHDYDNLKNSLKIAAISVSESFGVNQFEQIEKDLPDKIDLIIFPEDMLRDINGDESLEFYKKLSKELKTNLLATFTTKQNGKRYNSTVLFDANGEITDTYNKNRLILFGEYWPFGNWRPFFYDWLKKTNSGSEEYAIFKPENAYHNGDKKILSIKQGNETINFSPLICLEIQYPADLKKYKEMGAKFFVNPSSNRWIDTGINQYLYLTNNLRKIEVIWLKTPIVISGVQEHAGIIEPGGKIKYSEYQNAYKNYGIFIGEIRY